MKTLVQVISALSLVFILACVATPDSDRSAFIVIPFSQEVTMGKQAYKDILSKEKETTNIQLKQMVERVGRRIAAVSAMPNLEWEFKVIDSKQKNAFALPGGKTAIYTGILPVCLNEAGLAAVLGHEIAHVTARHSGQRMSQQFLLMGALSAAQISLSNNAHRATILGALGVGAMYGIQLPFSRSNESEADNIGLKYMARAGYDPREAVVFWTRFSKEKDGKAPPEFFSTHPSDNTRIRNLEKNIPRAMADYRASKVKYGKGKNFPIIASQPATTKK
jgi:predicted Zn-dependent protease